MKIQNCSNKMWNSTFKNKPRQGLKRSGFRPRTSAEVMAILEKKRLKAQGRVNSFKRPSYNPDLPSKTNLKRGSMTSTIPPKLRAEMASDAFYKQCCITGRSDEKIEWHHNLIFAGKRVNAKFAILPLIETIHENITYYKEECDWIMLNRATDEELAMYSKVIDYKRERERLNKIYGKR